MPDIKPTMLVVDDEMEILRMLREVFELRKWNVISTPTGTSVISIMDKEKVDIILLDVRLPDGSGIDVLREVKNKYPNIPVVIYTAYGYEDELVNETIRLGAAGYVSKNVPLRELVEVVNNMLVR